MIEFDDKRETWMHLLFFKARLGRIKKMYKVIRYNQKMYHNILWCFSNHSVLMSFTRLESGLKHWTIFRPFLVQQLNMTSVGQNKQSFLHVQLITSADLSILKLYPRNWLVENLNGFQQWLFYNYNTRVATTSRTLQTVLVFYTIVGSWVISVSQPLGKWD